MFRLILLILTFASCNANEEFEVSKISDGVLVTGGQPLQAEAGEWTVVVALDAPHVPDSLYTQFVNAKTLLEGDYVQQRIAKDYRLSWTHRLEDIERRIPTLHRFGRRGKRGALNFFGSLAHDLIGVATDQMVQECRDAVDAARGETAQVVHEFNSMISVVNQTREHVKTNRRRLQEVEIHLSRIHGEFRNMSRRIYGLGVYHFRLEAKLEVEAVLSSLETIVTSYERSLRHYQRQRASLEIGRLTEELFPLSDLEVILKHGQKLSLNGVKQREWYYQYVVVEPIWGDADTLLFRAKLPLVDSIEYLHYSICSWPQPLNKSGFSAQLMVPPVIGLDTQHGGIFIPHQCMGVNPMVCRTGPIFSQERLQCSRGIVIGDREQRHTCQIRLRQGESKTEIDEINPGQYIVTTWGEVFSLRCATAPEHRSSLKYGTYLITVPEGCVATGKGWTLPGIVRRMTRITVQAIQVTGIPPFNLTAHIPVQVASEFLLQEPHWTPMGKIHDVTLKKLREPRFYTRFDWGHHGSHLSWGVFIIVVVAITIAIAFVIWYCKKHKITIGHITEILKRKKSEGGSIQGSSGHLKSESDKIEFQPLFTKINFGSLPNTGDFLNASSGCENPSNAHLDSNSLA